MEARPAPDRHELGKSSSPAAADLPERELFRSTQVATRFVSIDWWRSEAAWQAFRESWGEAYSELDATLQPVAAGGKLLAEGQAETG